MDTLIDFESNFEALLNDPQGVIEHESLDLVEK